MKRASQRDMTCLTDVMAVTPTSDTITPIAGTGGSFG